jgi:hypothetical protein
LLVRWKKPRAEEKGEEGIAGEKVGRWKWKNRKVNGRGKQGEETIGR